MILRWLGQVFFGKNCKYCGIEIKSSDKNQRWQCKTCYQKLDSDFEIYKLEASIYALFPYTKQVQYLIHRGKYKFDKQVWNIWHEYVDKAMRGLGWEDYLVISVPSSRQRIRERGFNQVEEVLRNIPKDRKVNLLKRVKHLSSATLLGRKERLEQMRGCFALKDEAMLVIKNLALNRKIVIFDDVYTTGTTLGQIINLLIEAGIKAENVKCICITSPRLKK